MSAHVLLNLLNELGKTTNARLCRSSNRFSPTSLINSIIQEHKCKILLSYDTNIAFYLQILPKTPRFRAIRKSDVFMDVNA